MQLLIVGWLPLVFVAVVYEHHHNSHVIQFLVLYLAARQTLELLRADATIARNLSHNIQMISHVTVYNL